MGEGATEHVEQQRDHNDAAVATYQPPPHSNDINGTNGTHTANATLAEGLSEAILQNGDTISGTEGESGADGGSRKRKHDSISKSGKSSRAPSPPWKKVAAEGPTNFIVDGKRKSSRTNPLPVEMQPASDQRRTRQALNQSKPRPSYAALHNGTASSPASVSKSKAQLPRQRRPSSSLNSPAQTHFKKPPPPTKSKAPPQSPTHRRSSGNARPSSPVSERKSAPSSPTKSKNRRSSRHAEASAPLTPARQQPSVNGSYHGTPGSGSPNFQRLRIRVNDPRDKLKGLPKRHPGHWPLKKYTTFDEFLQKDHPLEGETDVPLTDEQVVKEAKSRIRVAQAAVPSGLLSQENLARFADDGFTEPPPRYGHWSHLAAHALHFRTLLNRESLRHTRMAKQVAIQCQQEILNNPKFAFLREAKSEEQIFAELAAIQKTRWKQVNKDIAKKWEMALDEVKAQKKAQYLQEQEVLGQKALDEMLDKSTALLNQNSYRESSEFPSESADRSSVDPFGSEAETGAEQSGNESDGSRTSEDDENMSESDDDEEEGISSEIQDEDVNLSPEALKRKYAALLEESAPPHSSDIEDEEDDDADDDDEDQDTAIKGSPNGASELLEAHTELKLTELDVEESIDGPAIIDLETTNGAEAGVEVSDESRPVIEEVDDILMDDSDQSTDMDSDMGTSDEENDFSDTGSIEDEDEAENSLLGFFGTSEKVQLKLPDKVDPNVEVDATGGADEEDIPLGKDQTDAPKTNGVNHDSYVEYTINGHAASELSKEGTPGTPQTPRPKTDVPSLLLRGKLREYQHDGLDWLANLYVGNRNGILADEMGLGKTIQTISLLAHLAVKHEIWGPHLIVVPSSVILNWEIEFKKWCPGFKILTYYGDQNLRKTKREGWLDDDKWNVIITSYNLILKDAQAFKRRAWHYLILDEAHNIKNFKSQRWNVMLSFRTHSRLLLTGTPLQNNLQELWSLLYFLMPAGIDGSGGFADLEKFLNSMKRPADQILDQGRQKLDPEAQARVSKLHEVLRPFLLRRLKSEVEKQMPAKYEHVVYCRLSKRQRQLYDEFMGRSDTKRTLSSGNYMSIINCLMSLRKVCNHPDLFETRQIVTSYAMPKSVVADYEITELLIRRRLLAGDATDDDDCGLVPTVNEDHYGFHSIRRPDLDYCGLIPTANEKHSRLHSIRRDHLKPINKFQELANRQELKVKSQTGNSISTLAGARSCLAAEADKSVLAQLKNCVAHSKRTAERWPIYGTDLVKLLTIPRKWVKPRLTRRQQLFRSMGDWYLDTYPIEAELMPTLDAQAARFEVLVSKFGCITPAVVAEDVLPLSLTPNGVDLVQQVQQLAPKDPYHEARVRLSIAFPDKRLLQYDCGKLQRLDKLLRQLQAGGHRCLIFTQMTKVLDILEQFLNIHGHRYLRLDGATKIEQRQIMTDRFNEDKSILAFILSSRSGGLGINLTGADTVIFYDLDWNPAMDAQCQDRCHRIGQTRDVHIYRFVSEYTIEANILRKSNQKRLLDDVIIQKGEFTTDYFNRVTYRDAFEDPLELNGEDADASAAMDRVLGEVTGLGQVLESVEDKEDTVAAKAAQKEMILGDDADFNESTQVSNTPKSGVPTTPMDPVGELAAQAMAMDDEKEHVDEYLLRYLMDYEYRGVSFRPVDKARKRDRKGRGRR